jgi:ParB family chromosome partitioning protein
MPAVPAQKVEMIPLDKIIIVNPRDRNKKLFKEIVANIGQIGLKRPITVTRRMEADGPFYDLVCGQGRVEAFRALGQDEVPALVVNANPQDCLIASLVENCARRQHRAIDLLQDIGGMKKRGYGVPEIARKTGLSTEYIYAVVNLLERGEERLLRAVEAGQIPFSVALEIADAEDKDIQAALQTAYEKNILRGKKLLTAKKIVEARRKKGKALKSHFQVRLRPVSSEALMQAFQEDTDRKRILIRRAEAAKSQLTFITQAVRKLLDDVALRGILSDEGFASLPEGIARKIESNRGH